jgi:hypothetical protein
MNTANPLNESTYPDAWERGYALSRLIRRLRIGVAWQWRREVLIDEIDSVGGAIADLCRMTLSSVLCALFLPVGLFLVLWRFTGGMIWQVCTVEDEVIEKLAVKLRRAIPHTQK